jgi:hypothetical protein
MRDIPFVECIAERALVLLRSDGATVDITLQIGRPVPVPEYNIPSACPFRLVGLEKEEKLYAVGIDSAQALQLATQSLAAWLDITGKIHGGKFVAFDGEDHGFPRT